MPASRRVHGSALVLLVCACLLALAGLLTAQRARATGGPPPTATPTCASSQLQLKFVDFQGATGHRFWDFAFKNTGVTCTARGYPRNRLLGKHGHSLGRRVTHEPGTTPQTVILAHGKRAFFTFEYVDGGFCPGPGRSFDAFRFELFAPGATHGTVFNPLPHQHGIVPSLCKGTTHVFPLRATLAPAHDA